MKKRIDSFKRVGLSIIKMGKVVKQKPFFLQSNLDCKKKGLLRMKDTNYIAFAPAIAVFSASSLSGESFCSDLIVERSEPAELFR